jgi:hypothetical protein
LKEALRKSASGANPDQTRYPAGAIDIIVIPAHNSSKADSTVLALNALYEADARKNAFRAHIVA